MKASEFKAKIIEFRKYEKLGILVRDLRQPPHVEPVMMLGIIPEEQIVTTTESAHTFAINAFLLMEFMMYIDEPHYEITFMHSDNHNEVFEEQQRRIKAYSDSMKVH